MPQSVCAPTPRDDHTLCSDRCSWPLILILPMRSDVSDRSRDCCAASCGAAALCSSAMAFGAIAGGSPHAAPAAAARGSSSSPPPNAQRNSARLRKPSASASTRRTSSWICPATRSAMPSHSRPPQSSPQVSSPVREALNARNASTTCRPLASRRPHTRACAHRSARRSNSSATRNTATRPAVEDDAAPSSSCRCRRFDDRTSSYHARRSTAGTCCTPHRSTASTSKSPKACSASAKRSAWRTMVRWYGTSDRGAALNEWSSGLAASWSECSQTRGPAPSPRRACSTARSASASGSESAA
mmetsp:Transcript_17215/g.58208  ORF Transcript_17215/g.58208 Transcript_17215/m.58208 type:complete len:300 (+) Transcript_17215:689-1588(+)